MASFDNTERNAKRPATADRLTCICGTTRETRRMSSGELHLHAEADDNDARNRKITLNWRKTVTLERAVPKMQ